MTSGLELPASARATSKGLHLYRLGMYLIKHPGSQGQLIRFLFVGASGYVVNTVFFYLLLHGAGLDNDVSFAGAFLAGCANNFFWNRHWTFKAVDQGAVGQATRFLLVQVIVAACAYLIFKGLALVIWSVPADMLAWIIVTPLSFLVQKVWSFRA